MVFTLVSAAQEWLSMTWDNAKKYAEDEKERRLKEEEEAEQVRFFENIYLHKLTLNCNSILSYLCHYRNDLKVLW